MAETVETLFRQRVEVAATTIHDQVADEFPDRAGDAQMIGKGIARILFAPDMFTAYHAWMTVGAHLYGAAQCECGNDRNHEFMRRCSGIVTEQQVGMQGDLMRELLEEIGFDNEEIASDIVKLLETHILAKLNDVEEVSAPDYVPPDWTDDD